MIKNVAILIHGYTLLASEYRTAKNKIGRREWSHIVWGDEERQLLGRIPHGILLALTHRPRRLIFGTGASCIFEGTATTRQDWETRGMPRDVTWEAEIAYETTLQKFYDLTRFNVLRQAINNFGRNEAREFTESISITDVDCNNTKAEIANALNLCNSESIDALISVTNASHTPRCVVLANKEIRQRRYGNLFYGTSPCDTDFSEDEEPLIFEPQSGHGPKNKLSPCTVLRGYFNLSYEGKMDFLESAKAILEKGNNEGMKSNG